MPAVVQERPSSLRPAWSAAVGDYAIGVDLGPDGGCAVGAGGGDVMVFDEASGRLRWHARAHEGGLLALAWNPAAAVLATAGQDGFARLWDGVSGRRLCELPGAGPWVEQLAWSPDGARLATAAGKTVRVWTRNGQPERETDAHASTVTGLAWSRSGQRLATACYGGAQVWDAATGKLNQQLEWKGSLISLAWSPDGSVIAGGCQDCSVHFWRLPAGKSAQMTGFPSKPRAISWERGGKLLATSGAATATVWPFSGKGPEGRAPIELAGHEETISALAFSPSGPALASGAQDGAVMLWEPRRQKTPYAQASLGAPVTAIAWSPSGTRLAGADSAGHVMMWVAE